MKVRGINRREVPDPVSGLKHDIVELFGIDNDGFWEFVPVPKDLITAAGVIDLDILIGSTIEVYYDKYGKIKNFRFC